MKFEFEFKIVPSIERHIFTSSNLNSYTLKHPCINSGTTEAPVYIITVCTLAKDGAVDRQFKIGQAVADGVCTYTANTRTLTFNDGDLVAGDNLYVQYEYIWGKGMDFEEALKAMREGKKVKRAKWKNISSIWIDKNNGEICTDDKLYDRVMSFAEITADDWEICEETERKNVMNFEEARKALLEGKKIRSTHWNKDTYICFVDKNLLVKENEGAIQYYGIYDVYRENEWELYEEKPKADIITKNSVTFYY